MITHDLNGPFLRSHNASPTPQTETVYGIKATYFDGTQLVWNTHTEPRTRDHVEKLRESARWSGEKDGHGALMALDLVSREVTISATPWTELPE